MPASAKNYELLPKHDHTWVNEAHLGMKFPPYLPTFRFPEPSIDAEHARIGAAPIPGGMIDLGIPGWLRLADALKIYELAYFARGDVIEFGSYNGLSTSIIAAALHNAGEGHRLLSLENNAHDAAKAKRNTAQWSDLCTFTIGDARETCQALISDKRVFDFAFVDHSHAYDLTRVAAEDLKKLLMKGGFALFHDFNDDRNGISAEYGVWQAVRDAFADGSFEFYGIYGCSGLWRRV